MTFILFKDEVVSIFYMAYAVPSTCAQYVVRSQGYRR